ncbi:MAG TPA: nucleotidyltransferase family protein [Oxalicibacterium sp.]|nr:nucleotidyltransferase family protein [Oxalicibacterium sp.]
MLPCRDQIVGVLLAAGKGVRFDPVGERNKLLQVIRDGRKVGAAAADSLHTILPTVIAVVRDESDALAAELRDAGCITVACADADSGMAASLVCGLRHTAEAAGWIIALGDMPYVEADTIAVLAAALHDGADIAVPVYQGTRGNPVGFSRRHLPALLRLSGDRGARELLQSLPVTAVLVDDEGILRDIDTARDLPYIN